MFASKYLKRTFKKELIRNRVHQIGPWYEVFIKRSPLCRLFCFYIFKTFGEKSYEIGSIRYVAWTKY